MKKIKLILSAVMILSCVAVHSQIYLADNGLTASGSGTSKTVSLGGTMNNAATAIDLGSSNSSSNLLLKKGSANYFFIANDGKIGFGTITPSVLVDINGAVNISGATILGASGGSAPAEMVVNYLGSSAYSGKGLKLKDNTTGFIVRMHAVSSGLYLTTDNGTATGLVLGSRFNPGDNSEFRASSGRWEIRAGAFSVNQDWGGTGQVEMTIGSASRKGIIVKAAASQTASLQEWQNSSGTSLATISSDGKGYFSGAVSIGTTVTDANYKLLVDGWIRTRKIRVDQATWPDYVFHPNYDLPALTDVEKFIQQNKHLPEVPSAQEVEEKGLDLGDNQATLLRKIEELTLYLIEQNKKIEQLQKEVTTLKKQN